MLYLQKTVAISLHGFNNKVICLICSGCGYLLNFLLWPVTPSYSWLRTCRIFLSHLTVHIAGLKLRIAESEDADSRLTFRFSGIISYTTYAQIVFVLAMSPLSSVDSAVKFRDECSDALHRIIMLVEELEPGEFFTLDAILGVSASNLCFNSLVEPMLDNLVPCVGVIWDRTVAISTIFKRQRP